jgi:hypothetical protein
MPRNDSWRASGSQRCADCQSRRAVAGGWLLACPPGADDHVVADAAGDVVVQAEADDAVIAGVERAERIFSQHRARTRR